MELPTYTNIWKIEKRLYKLYDFRLPMPLPIGQVAAFLAIAIPYMLILTMAGMPFSHTWVWLYVLPPGVLAWLVTRPVLEGKRLPELMLSHFRYLSEPRTWCRMAPLAEKDQIVLAARVWRRSAAPPRPVPAAAAPVDARQANSVPDSVPDSVPGAMQAEAGLAGPFAGSPAESVRPVWPTRPAIAAPQGAGLRRVVVAPPGGTQVPASAPAIPVTAPAAPAGPAGVRARAASVPARGTAAPARAAPPQVHVSAPPGNAGPPAGTASGGPAPVPPAGTAAAAASTGPAEAPPRPTARPALTVRTDGAATRPLHVVERALRSSPGSGADGWHDRVVVVPGGHRPGKPDQVQRDQARARLLLPSPARIVVLGCTAGAGQTTTTLLAGQLLASLRGEAVAVLDLSAGPGSLTERARQVPCLLPNWRSSIGSVGRDAARDDLARTDPADPDPVGNRSGLGAERGLQVITADSQDEQADDAGRLIDAVVARYPITLADPAARQVPRAVNVADQLVLVAPASADAASALAMTIEWLEAHGHADLARTAVTVLNGVSEQTAEHVDKAAAIAAGRCRAVVRVPWDGRLAGGSALGIAAIQAYTALAGVLVSGLADPAIRPIQSESGHR